MLPVTLNMSTELTGSDLKVLVEMVKYVRTLAEISPLKEVIGTSTLVFMILFPLVHTSSQAAELNPGPNVKTDDQIEGK